MSLFRITDFARLTLSAGLWFGSLAGVAVAQAPAEPSGEGEATADPFAVPDGDSFLLSEPKTAEEFLRAALQSQQLARPSLARLYLQGLLAANPNDETLLKLRDKYGPAAFSRLANQPELQPFSTQLLDRVNEVFRRRGADPQRIETLLDALGGPPEEAFAARESLVNAGEAVVPQILSRLQAESEGVARQQFRDLLVEMGEPILPPLHAALDAPAESFRVQILTVIGRIGSRESIPYLYRPAYALGEPIAIRTAAREALSAVARTSRVSADITDPADVADRLTEAAVAGVKLPASNGVADAPPHAARVWSWDRQAGTVRAADLDADGASLYRGAQFARDAFAIAPNRTETQALYFAYLLGLDAYRAGTLIPPAGPGTAFNSALAAGPDTAAEVLRLSLRHGIPRAAVGALGVLAQTASPSVLFSSEDVIADALNHPDPRVQLAAAVAVLRLNPDRPFSRAGRVIEILNRALSEGLEPTAVIIDPSFQRGSTLAGFAREMGYDAVLAQTGREGFTVAAERMHPSFILVNLNVARWPLSQTLANLRADTRTRNVPVIVFGPREGDWSDRRTQSSRYTLFSRVSTTEPRGKVTEYLADIPGAAYVVETATVEAFDSQVRPVLASLISDPLTPEERSEARRLAAYWLAQIADTRRTGLFPFSEAEPALISALFDPALADNALVALSAIPTSTAQRAMADVVVAPTADNALRTTGAEVLADHVRRFGLLISDETALELYRVWDSTEDPSLRTAMAAWGGTLRPGSARVRTTLEASPPLTPPVLAP